MKTSGRRPSHQRFHFVSFYTAQLHFLIIFPYQSLTLSLSLSLFWQKAYADPGDLEARVVSLLKIIKYKCLLQKQQQQQRRACPPPTSSSVDMMSVSSSSRPLHTNTNNNNFAGGTFQSGNNIPCTTAGGLNPTSDLSNYTNLS